MKKTNNKGFSLVELIIVIAIMAILAGAIAPALIKYIDKSRKSNDVSSAKTIKTAIETALGTEEVYEILTNTSAYTSIAFAPGKPATEEAAAGGSNGTNIKIAGCTVPSGVTTTIADCAKLIGSNIGEKNPKAKYQKNIDVTGEKVDSGFKPTGFVAFITSSGTVYVCVANVSEAGAIDSECKVTIADNTATFTKCAPLTPDLCKGYQ